MLHTATICSRAVIMEKYISMKKASQNPEKRHLITDLSSKNMTENGI